MRTQENREKYKEYDHKYYIKNRRPRTKIGQLELQIDQLKQQLAEKDKEIHSLIVDYEKRISQEQELMSNLEKELTELKEKDNYHLRYELAGADETITNLKKQLEEKDKEIELLKHLGNHETATEMFKENAKLIIEKRQLAIQELEKVKNFVDGRTYCADYINKRIQDLKGEKDVKD